MTSLVKASPRRFAGLLCALALLCLMAPLAFAQSAAQTTAQTLDSVRAAFDRIEKSLERADIDDAALQALRSEIDPLRAMGAEILRTVEPRLEAARAPRPARQARRGKAAR